LERLIGIGEWIKRRFFPVRFDAVEHEAESYYAGVYHHYIERHQRELGGGRLRILDAGCGTGRFLIPLAKAGHQMTAVDYYRDSLRLARNRANAEGLEIDFQDGDLHAVLREREPDAFDIALSIEVLHNSRDIEAALRDLHRVVRPGGLVIITHRTRFFFLAQSLVNGNLDDALYVARESEGRLLKKSYRIHRNWQSLEQIAELYPRLGFQIRGRYPIGPLSGFATDPMTPICDPGQLSEKQREILREIELSAAPEMLATARYLLVVAEKMGPAAPH
jgi:SAM-dependent methyltransferase